MGGQEPVVDPSRPLYVYVQIADHIAGLIAGEKLKPGARLEASGNSPSSWVWRSVRCGGPLRNYEGAALSSRCPRR